MKKCSLFVMFVFCASLVMAQDAAQLIKKVKAKLELVNNYEATGVMKTDIAFIKAPIGKIKIYFKKPNLFKKEYRYFSEVGNYATAINKGTSLFKGRGYRDLVKALTEDLNKNFTQDELRNNDFAAMQDIIDGFSNSRVKVKYGHDLSYWKDAGAVNKEVFANLMNIYGDEDGNRARKQVNFLKKYFPDIIEEHEKFIKEYGNE